MELNTYAAEAQKTAVFTRNDYPLVALGEEVGEVMGKIAKYGRKNNMSVEEVINSLHSVEIAEIAELRKAVKKELGDVLWQWAVLCNVLGMSPNRIAEENLSKLADRQNRDVLNGEGDNR